MKPKGAQEFRFTRVLLIDDNDIDNLINERLIVTNFFSEKVVIKNSGQSALDYLKTLGTSIQVLPEIIFLDLNMPDFDGFQFMEEYGKFGNEIKNFCKVIVLSSSISPDDINRASTNPFVLKYINKPLNEKYLEAINVR